MEHRFSSPRLRREAHTVVAMIHRYCRDRHHTTDGLCPECTELLAYARRRLARCPFQEDKTTCGKCPVHCYAPAMRERIREVMRYAGPRMVWSHPLMALRHLLDGLRKPRPRP
jgi:predicted amidophosphoribosyltransferase